MLIISPRKGENIDRMIRRYKKKVEQTKLTKKVKSKLHFTKGSELRRKEILKAVHRDNYKRRHLS